MSEVRRCSVERKCKLVDDESYDGNLGQDEHLIANRVFFNRREEHHDDIQGKGSTVVLVFIECLHCLN